MQEKYFRAGSVLLPGDVQTPMLQVVKNINTWDCGNKLWWHHPLLFKCSSRRNSSVGQWRCNWFAKIAVGKQAVESACLNLLSLNFRIINWVVLSRYGINFEQQTIFCLKQSVRIYMYINIGYKVRNIVFQIGCLCFRTVPTLINSSCKLCTRWYAIYDIYHFLCDPALRCHSQRAIFTNVFQPPSQLMFFSSL
jgi:hypothetical protein